ncbi:MAG: hypothetical protein ACOCZC_02870 [Halodesulfurarchaeum sp.]
MATSSTHDASNGPPPRAGIVLEPLQAVAFWAAIGLPFIYVPLVVRGLETVTVQMTVAVLLALHVITLVLGRQYNAD